MPTNRSIKPQSNWNVQHERPSIVPFNKAPQAGTTPMAPAMWQTPWRLCLASFWSVVLNFNHFQSPSQSQSLSQFVYQLVEHLQRPSLVVRVLRKAFRNINESSVSKHDFYICVSHSSDTRNKLSDTLSLLLIPFLALNEFFFLFSSVVCKFEE